MREKLNLYALSKEEGQALWFLDTLTFIKATGNQTGGNYGLIEQIIPTGYKSPYHIHHNEDEAFYILEGEATFINGDRIIKVTAGSYIFLPRGIPHGFKVDVKCRLLLLATPGGFEQFVIEMGKPVKEFTLPPISPQDMEKLTTLAVKYGIEILGPLPEI